MDIRKDLESVTGPISRLLHIGEAFAALYSRWGHLKNDEDFHDVSRIPYEHRYKVDALYADGRRMAFHMFEALGAINSDFIRYPTLSSIVQSFEGGYDYGEYGSNVVNIAEATCKEYDVCLWSVREMASTYRQQEKLLSVVDLALQLLKSSDLYKLECGESILNEKTHVYVSGVTGSNVIVNSSNVVSNVASSYNEPAVFSELLTAVKTSGLDSGTVASLVSSVQALAASHKSGGFKDEYKNFMQTVSAHITVFSPFIAALTSLL